MTGMNMQACNSFTHKHHMFEASRTNNTAL
jgi:hypothetical protein